MASHKACHSTKTDYVLLKKADVVAEQRERRRVVAFCVPLFSLAAAQQQLTKNMHPIYALLYICMLDVVFRQILTFLEDSVAIVYGLKGL